MGNEWEVRKWERIEEGMDGEGLSAAQGGYWGAGGGGGMSQASLGSVVAS